ncbi:MAG: phage portal protein [Methanocorpusculum sp.]|nr:phage portal protein [Methanocorpusculum sp.]
MDDDSLFAGLAGPQYLSIPQKDTLLKYIQIWFSSIERAEQLKSQEYYEGIQDISHKMRQFKNPITGQMSTDTTLPNAQFPHGLYRRIIDQKVQFIAKRKLKFVTLSAHYVDYNDPRSVETETQGDVEPEKGYKPVRENEIYQIASDKQPTREESKRFISILDNLFNEKWYLDVRDILTYALIDGDCWIYPYIDENKNFAIRVFRGQDICPIYTDDRRTALAAAVRMYEWHPPEAGAAKQYYIEIYRKENILRYQVKMGHTLSGGNVEIPVGLQEDSISAYIEYAAQQHADAGVTYPPVSDMPHFTEPILSPIPPYPTTYRWTAGIPFIHVQAERPPRPLLKRCKEFLDKLNAASSCWSDIMNMYPDKGYLIVKHAVGTDADELWDTLYRNRVLMVEADDEGEGDVKFLEIPIPTADYIAHMDKLQKWIYDYTAAYDDTNPNLLQGNLHDAAMKNARVAMENDGCILIYTVEEAMTRLIQDFFCPYLVTKGWPDFSRTSVRVRVNESEDDLVERSNTMVSMGLRLSQRTMQENHMLVDDVDEEMDRLRQDDNKVLMLEALKQKQAAEIQMDMQKEQQKMQMEMQEKQHQMQMETMKLQGGMHPAGGTAAGENRIGMSPDGSKLNSGSSKGGGKGADVPTALAHQEKKNKDPTSAAQPQR